MMNQIQSAMTAVSGEKLIEVLDTVMDNIWEMGNLVNSGILIRDGMNELLDKITEVCRYLYRDDPDAEAVLSEWGRCSKYCWNRERYEQIYHKYAGDLTDTIQNTLDMKEKRPIRQIKQYIQEHFNEDITLNIIAEELDLSPSYVSKLFKKELNIGFVQYLNELRIEYVKQMLTTTSDSVGQIADKVGYHDEKYLMRLFKKEVGLTTNEYRRLHGD